MAADPGDHANFLYIASLLPPWHQRSGWVGNAWHLGRNCLARLTDKVQEIRREGSEMRGIRQIPASCQAARHDFVAFPVCWQDRMMLSSCCCHKYRRTRYGCIYRFDEGAVPAPGLCRQVDKSRAPLDFLKEQGMFSKEITSRFRGRSASLRHHNHGAAVIVRPLAGLELPGQGFAKHALGFPRALPWGTIFQPHERGPPKRAAGPEINGQPHQDRLVLGRHLESIAGN